MQQLLSRQIDVLWNISFAMLVGTALAVACVGAGWFLGQRGRAGPARLVSWWVDHVVDRIVRAGSWWHRFVGIFVNNTAVTALLVAAGAWAAAAWAGVICVGLSLGIGLRVMSRREGLLQLVGDAESARAVRRVRVGVALNMLEPPAIAIAVGLSLCQQASSPSIPAAQAWETFAVCAVPLLLVAAAGEALWMEATIPKVVAPPVIDLQSCDEQSY